MKDVPILIIILLATALTVVFITIHSNNQQHARNSLSWRRLRYFFTVVSVLGATIVALQFQLLTAHADTTPDITHVMCGSAASFPQPQEQPNTWTAVSSGSTAYQPDGTPITATGYTGSGYDQFNHYGPCSGDYHYGWDQYYHRATWIWPYSFPGNVKECRVQVYIPTWYAGAPDAQYSITIPGISNTPRTFTLNQNQPTGGVWQILDFAGNGQGYIQLGGNSYRFEVTLLNGGGQGKRWYLGADAIRFECNYSSGQQV